MRSYSGRQPSRFAPACEALEDRLVPSCTFAEPGGNRLIVFADDQSNTISITDNGTQTAGNITVQCDGVTWVTTSQGGIKEMQVYTNDGDDFVSYTVGGNLGATSLRSITVSLGDDNDTFNARVGGNLAGGSQLRFTVAGGEDEDGIFVSATYFQVSGGVNVQAGARMELNLSGGDDDDFIATDYRGRVAAGGLVDINISSGEDDGTVSSYLELLTGTLGNVNARIFGGEDEDNLSLIARRQSPQSDAAAGAATNIFLIDGGDDDDDICTRTANVIAINCEEDRVVT
jgi:hypothetical protein